jgi:hypothetical protein
VQRRRARSLAAHDSLAQIRAYLSVSRYGWRTSCRSALLQTTQASIRGGHAVVSAEASLRRELQKAGLTNRAIAAVWPEWWSSDAEASLSAATELRYTVARRLGISPSSLFDGPPRFVWRDEAKFKNLGTASKTEQGILTSFGVAAGRALISAAPPPLAPPLTTATELRRDILESSSYVRLDDLVVACWSLGIPVVKTNVYPLPQKRMQAVTIRLDDRYAILIGRDSTFPAWIAFILAHEIGHIVHGHITGSAALLEMGDLLQAKERDDEELEADRFALALLTGNERPVVTSDAQHYSALQVASAVLRTGPEERIDPGVLALCLAYSTGRWKQSIGALKRIDGQEFPEDVGVRVNRIADNYLDWSSLTSERADYLHKILGINA